MSSLGNNLESYKDILSLLLIYSFLIVGIIYCQYLETGHGLCSKRILLDSRTQAMVWSRNDIEKACDQPKPTSSLDLPDSTTAVSMAPVLMPDDSYLVSFGLDNGSILLYKWKPSCESNWLKCCVLGNLYAHHLTVKRLKFRPVVGIAGDKANGEKDSLQLASCSLDHSVRIFNINMNKLPT